MKLSVSQIRNYVLTALVAATTFVPAAVRADIATAHLPWATSMVNTTRTQTLAGTTTYNGVLLNEYSADKIMFWAEDGNTFSENRTQCNSFVAGVIKRANNLTDTAFKAKFGSTWPSADTWYTYITTANSTNFNQIPNIASMQPGDILAITYRNDPNADNTGHVMVVNEVRPVASFTFSENNLTVYYHDVQVMDSSSGVHSLDTRIFQAGELGQGSLYTELNGAGRGWMRIYVDANGACTGYTWSMTGNKSNPVGTAASLNYYSTYFKPNSLRMVAAGRLK